MTFEKILEKKPTEGTVSMQIFVPTEIHEWAKESLTIITNLDETLTLGDIYLNLVKNGIYKVRKNADLFTAKREKKEVFEHDKVYTVLYCPEHVNTQIEAIREKFGGVSKHKKSNSPKWSGRIPKRQIFSFLLCIGFANMLGKP